MSKKVVTIKAQETLRSEIQELEEKIKVFLEENPELADADYIEKVNEKHSAYIKQLHEYNQLKDIGQMLLGHVPIVHSQSGIEGKL